MMFEELGKRSRRPVVREGFLEEEEFERILMEDYGLSREELDSDLEIIGRRGGFILEEATISHPDGSEIPLRAEADRANYVLAYLDRQSAEIVDAIWQDRDNRAAIASLIRHPGGQHEWLMVAALPYLKWMGIPLVWMKRFRTETGRCLFYYQEDEEWYQGQHCGEGSTRMHNHLLQCFRSVYQQGDCHAGAEAGERIAAELRHFAQEHFREDISEPDALTQLIEALENEL